MNSSDLTNFLIFMSGQMWGRLKTAAVLEAGFLIGIYTLWQKGRTDLLWLIVLISMVLLGLICLLIHRDGQYLTACENKLGTDMIKPANPIFILKGRTIAIFFPLAMIIVNVIFTILLISSPANAGANEESTVCSQINDTLVVIAPDTITARSETNNISVYPKVYRFLRGSFTPPVATITAVLISFILGQVALKLRNQNQRRKKYISLMKLIAYEFKQNLDILCQNHAYLYVGIVRTYDLSLFTSKEILQECLLLSGNEYLTKHLLYEYFEFGHIQNRMDSIESGLMSRLSQSGSVSSSGFKENFINGTCKLIRDNVEGVLKVRNALSRELRKYGVKEEISKDTPKSYLDELYERFQNAPEVVETAKLKNRDLSLRPKFYDPSKSIS